MYVYVSTLWFLLLRLWFLCPSIDFHCLGRPAAPIRRCMREGINYWSRSNCSTDISTSHRWCCNRGNRLIHRRWRRINVTDMAYILANTAERCHRLCDGDVCRRNIRRHTRQIGVNKATLASVAASGEKVSADILSPHLLQRLRWRRQKWLVWVSIDLLNTAVVTRRPIV